METPSRVILQQGHKKKTLEDVMHKDVTVPPPTPCGEGERGVMLDAQGH